MCLDRSEGLVMLARQLHVVLMLDTVVSLTSVTEADRMGSGRGAYYYYYLLLLLTLRLPGKIFRHCHLVPAKFVRFSSLVPDKIFGFSLLVPDKI